jgi:5'(3')-deoxyribonucleotidase
VKLKDILILIDLDSTTYDLATPWLEWYNGERWWCPRHKKHEDLKPLTPQDITHWGWHDLTHPCCQEKLYDFLWEPGMYASIKPFEGAQEAIRKVHEWGIGQAFCSTTISFTGPYDKMKAVQRDFPFIGKERVLITGGWKGGFGGQVLVDDGPHNLMAFKGPSEAAGGTNGPRLTISAQIQPAPYQKAFKADYELYDWKDYPELILRITKKLTEG